MELVNLDRYEVVDIERLVPADWNYKGEDVEIGEKLANNLKRNGQIENIIVRELETGALEVVNGNHRYFAMKTLGAPRIFACNLGRISTEEAIRIAIETNETKFPTDNVKLGTLVKELAGQWTFEQLAQTMPYNEKTLGLMAELPDFKWDGYGGAGTPTEAADDEKFKVFKVSLPEDVHALVEDAVAKMRRVIGKVTKRPCGDDIRPLECIALVIRDMDDAALAQAIG